MEKKDYIAPSLEIVVLEHQESLLDASVIVPSGPGTSVDHGSSAARPTAEFSIWDNGDSESEE